MSASPPCFPPHSHKLHWRHLECHQLLHPWRGQRPVHQRWSHQRITVFSPAKTQQPVIHRPLSGGDVPDKALLRKRFWILGAVSPLCDDPWVLANLVVTVCKSEQFLRDLPTGCILKMKRTSCQISEITFYSCACYLKLLLIKISDVIIV